MRITRRVVWQGGVAGLLLPLQALAAPPQKRSDLVVADLLWSTDAGITFGNGPVLEGDSVWFEAVVRNSGRAAWPSGTVLRVDFNVSGQLVTWSDTHTSGLARDASVTLRANTGVGGDQFWIAGQAAAMPVLARADPGNLILEESETNNTRSATMTIEPGDPPPGGDPCPGTHYTDLECYLSGA